MEIPRLPRSLQREPRSTVRSSAIVMGNIKSKSVQINNGAVIEGMCSQCYADVSPTSFFDDYKPEKKKVK